MDDSTIMDLHYNVDPLRKDKIDIMEFILRFHWIPYYKYGFIQKHAQDSILYSDEAATN